MKKDKPIIITVIITLLILSISIMDENLLNSVTGKLQSFLLLHENEDNKNDPMTLVDLELLVIPESNNKEFIIRHSGFSLLYSEEHEQAAWVAYVLNADEVRGEIGRSNNFREDPLIKSGSAKLNDYKGSGYDRGHLAPAGDMKWSESAMKDSFFLSNMSPQVPGFNRDIWKRLEEWTRIQAINNDEILVVTGPVLTDGPFEEIGENGIDIPKRYFKVLLDYTEPGIKAIGFIMKNEASKANTTDFAGSINDVEELTGLDFFYLLPDIYEENLESSYNISLWKNP
jgi:endonuclease G, mitochondrial